MPIYKYINNYIYALTRIYFYDIYKINKIKVFYRLKYLSISGGFIFENSVYFENLAIFGKNVS